MDLFHKLNSNKDFLEYFCDVLEDMISQKKGHRVTIDYRTGNNSIFFFIDGSSILEIMPDKDLQYTYANIPSFQNEIQKTILIIEKQYVRDSKISQIIKKES